MPSAPPPSLLTTSRLFFFFFFFLAVRRLQGKAEARESSQKMRRRFLLRLAVALHSYGSSAARTEYLIDKAADRLEVETSIAVFPSLILLSFPSVDENDPTR
jgi:uncharacterized membrane protein YjjP (DUF1212 family)